MKKQKLLTLLPVLALIGLTACGSNGTTSVAQSTTETKAAETTTAAETATSAADDKIRANDGTEVTSTTVNVYMPSPAGLQSALESGFEAKYAGIDMVVTSGTTGELEAKIEAEKANPVCDVLILASWSDGLSVINSYDLLAYTPSYADQVYDAYKESTNKIWGTSASAVGVIYNTEDITKDEIEKLDWADFGNSSKFNSDDTPMAIPDPTKSGACKDFLAGFVTSQDETAAWNTLNSLVDNGLQNGGGNKTALADVESGATSVLVGGVDYNAYSDKAKGKSIDIYYPKSGTVINPRPAMIMGSGSHNDAAKLVMDYLLSDEAQQAVADAYLLPGRKDCHANASRLDTSEITQFANLDWNTMAAKGTEIAQTLVANIKAAA